MGRDISTTAVPSEPPGGSELIVRLLKRGCRVSASRGGFRVCRRETQAGRNRRTVNGRQTRVGADEEGDAGQGA